MGKYKKTIVIILILVITLISTTVFASDLTNGVTISTGKVKEAEKIGNIIFGIARAVGIICSVAALMLIGIKYMLGSVEEKAEYKKTMGVYITGAILVFGVTVFAKELYTIVNNIIQ